MGSEVISVVERRRRWSTEEKLQVLMAALEPGASITAVAEQHGVARNLVYQWMRLALLPWNWSPPATQSVAA